MKNKKIICTVLALSFSLSVVLAGCGKDDKTVSDGYEMDPVLNELGSETICKEPVELEFMIPQNGNVIDYSTNKYTKQLEKKGNVTIKFNLLPAADAMTKINLIMASGTELPDVLVCTTMEDSSVATYGESGTFIPLNKYYEHSSEYLTPGIERWKTEKGIDIRKYLTMEDGNIYSIPRYPYAANQEIPALLYIYKPWLTKLGLDVPTNLEEFTSVLTAFKDNDMNQNGNKNDEIPLVDYTEGGLMTTLMQAFIETGFEDLCVDKKGNLSYAYMSDEYKEFLKYIKTLYGSSLLDKVTFSQDYATWKTLLNTDETLVGVFAAASTSCLSSDSPRRSEYVPMFLDNNGKKTLWYEEVVPDQAFFITSSCEHPEVAFRIGDYMCSEEMTMWQSNGEKGTDWVVVDTDEEGLYDFLLPDGVKPVKYKRILQWGGAQNSHWFGKQPSFPTETSYSMVSSTDASQKSKADALKLLVDRYGKDYAGDKSKYVSKLIFSTEELDERATIMAVTDKIVEQTMFEFISGQKDIDKYWDSYLKELKGANIDRLLEISQNAYDRMNEE